MTKKEALEELETTTLNGVETEPNRTYFSRFLRKVDRTPQQLLIEQLFGSKEAYIDTVGDYDENGACWSVVQYELSNGVDVSALFNWYKTNFEKSWRWMFPLRKTSLGVKNNL